MNDFSEEDFCGNGCSGSNEPQMNPQLENLFKGLGLNPVAMGQIPAMQSIPQVRLASINGEIVELMPQPADVEYVFPGGDIITVMNNRFEARASNGTHLLQDEDGVFHLVKPGWLARRVRQIQ